MLEASGALRTPERNHYYYGKLLTVSELEKEQGFFLEKQRLQRLTLGRGVVCGLDLVADVDEHVAIRPGLAIDGLGREIVVPETVAVDPRQPTDAQGQPEGDPLEAGTVEICLAYAEQSADLAPVLVPDCEGDASCSPCTVLESFHVIVRPVEDDPPEPPSCNPELPTAASELHEFLSRQIAERDPSDVPEDLCVVLGRVTLEDDLLIDTQAGRELVYTPRLLFDLLLCLTTRVSVLEAAQNNPDEDP